MTDLESTGAGTFYSAPFHVGTFTELIAFLTETSHAGTNPTLDVSFDISPDGRNWMASGDAFAQVTTADTTILKRITANFGDWMRVKVVIGGTNSPTFKYSLTIQAKG
jgi:hypothetical protein